jgi:hypothetical protein
MAAVLADGRFLPREDELSFFHCAVLRQGGEECGALLDPVDGLEPGVPNGVEI